jgi:hypothetical protein
MIDAREEGNDDNNKTEQKSGILKRKDVCLVVHYNATEF